METAVKLLFCSALLVNISAYAEVTTDGTVGGIQRLSGHMTIPQSLGTTAGNNLFHSFNAFNINTGESATFTGSDALKNVISRVTGGHSSSIDGLLQSTIKNANFYFINPAGVTFGANAKVDVPAAFHVSTADALRFTDGSQFSATDSTSSTLSIAEPSSFGFLGNSNSQIGIYGAKLATNTTGQDFNVVAGDIVITNYPKNTADSNAEIKAEAGSIRLSSVGKNDTTVPISGVAELAKGSITIDSSTVDVSGNGSGKLEIQGGEVSVTGNSQLLAHNTGAQDASLKQGINILADNLAINGSGIHTAAENTGQSGNFTASVSNKLTLLNGSVIGSIVGKIDSSGNFQPADGNAGNVSITAKTIDINASALGSSVLPNSKGSAGLIHIITSGKLSVVSGIIDSNTRGLGHAGSIEIDANEVLVDGQGTGGGISSGTNNIGNAGDVTIKSDSISVLNGGQITSSTWGSGNAGTVEVKEGTGSVSISSDGTLSSSTWGSGDAGKVVVNADSVKIDNQAGTQLTGIISRAEEGSGGKAGTVDVEATGTVEVLNNGEISSSTLGTGDAGAVSIKGESLSVSNGGRINSDTWESGNAGTVEVKEGTGSVSISNDGMLSSSTWGSGDAGKVVVNADSVKIDNQAGTQLTGIISRAEEGSGGKAGTIDVEATGTVEILNNGEISSSTLGTGDAGKVVVNADSVKIDNQAGTYLTGIISRAEEGSGGKAGTVDVEATGTVEVLNNGQISSSTLGTKDAGLVTVKGDSVIVSNGGQISSDTYGSGNAGTVSITGNSISASNDGVISSDTSSSGKAGNVEVIAKAGTVSVLSGGELRSNTTSSGDAGSVTVKAGTIKVDANPAGAYKTAIVSVADNGSTGKAGTVDVEATGTVEVLNNGEISSSTLGTGDAGLVTVKGDSVIVSNGGQISSDTWGSGNAGDIFITADKLSLAQSGFISSNNTDGNGGDINLTVKHFTLMEGGAISTTTRGLGNAGTIAVQNAEDVVIDGVDANPLWIQTDGQQVTGQFSGIYLNTNGAGNGGSLLLTTKNLSLSDGGVISAIAADGTTKNTGKTSAGIILINADKVDLKSGGLIAATTSSAAKAGSVTVNANESLTISGQFDHNLHPGVTNPRESDHTGILSNASHALDSSASKLGAGGSVTLNTANLIMSEGGLVSVSTEGDKEAGNVSITASLIALDNAAISSEAAEGSSGQTGDINVTASKALQLSNQSNISIQNKATVTNPTTIKPGLITVSAPDINIKNSSITAESTGNIDAGSIVTHFSHQLNMDPSFITTSANLGNGGNITINGGGLINLQDSGFLTSVTGADGNGGNINVAADLLVMNTGVIQANAKGGKGGDIGLSLKALIPSQDSLIKGGSQVKWQPYRSGFNVIQAASATGVSGNINLTSPQFNISGVISGLDSGGLALPVVDRNPCQGAALDSTLTRKGKGGIPITEAKTIFVSPITDLQPLADLSLPAKSEMHRSHAPAWECSLRSPS